MRAALLAALLCAAGGLAAAQAPSPAERASESERPLTEDEVARLIEACRIAPEPTGAAVHVAGRRDVPVIRLPAMRVLRLVEYRAAGNGEEIRAYPPLPFGGIGPRDLCRSVELRHLVPPAGGERDLATIGLQLRPSLDLASDYPTTGAEIARRGQAADLPAGLYALIAEEGAGDAVDWDALARDGDAPMDAGRPALVLGGAAVLLPVRAVPGD